MFQLVSDAANNYTGFYVDDLEVRSVQDSTLSIRVSNATPAILTYPNPAKNTITISLQGTNEQASTLAILYDCMGRETMKIDMEKPVVTIDVRQLPAGVYSLKIISNHASLPVHKIVVSK